MRKVKVLVCKHDKETSKSLSIEKYLVQLWQNMKNLMLATLCTEYLLTFDKSDEDNLSGCFCYLLEYYQFCDFYWNLKCKLNYDLWKICIDEEKFIEITNIITLDKLLKSISCRSFFCF